jgi:hypothetical protein
MRMMKSKGCPPPSIVHLKDTPYELWKGTNDFGDDFELLCFKADIEQYAKLELQLDNQFRDIMEQKYHHMADALQSLGRPIRFIAVELDVTGNVQTVANPERLEITSATVEAALTDAENLIRTSGAPSAVDRVHTALHGYLEQFCNQKQIEVREDESIESLFGKIRPSLHVSDPLAEGMIVQILRGMAKIIQALNSARDKRTLAHPNPLLGEPEAVLAINAARTLLHYLDKRLS